MPNRKTPSADARQHQTLQKAAAGMVAVMPSGEGDPTKNRTGSATRQEGVKPARKDRESRQRPIKPHFKRGQLTADTQEGKQGRGQATRVARNASREANRGQMAASTTPRKQAGVANKRSYTRRSEGQRPRDTARRASRTGSKWRGGEFTVIVIYLAC